MPELPELFVVESVQPGRSIDIKDILTGRRFHVLEQSASRSLRPGDLTFTRVVTAGGASIMIGASAWVIPADWHLSVIEFREEFSPRRLMTLDELRDYDLEILECYHGIIRELQHPTLPALTNTDGDPLEPTTMTYALGVTTAEAVERLRPLATLRGDVHIDGEVHDEAGVLTAATLTWMRAGNTQRRDWDNTVLGTLRLDGERLVVEVNSARRRGRIAKEIAKRLGTGATLVETTVTDIAEALEARRAADAEAGGGIRPGEPDAARSPEFEAMEAELAEKHWDAWVDMRVPALGNRTPRQAAKTARGRERLEALLTTFARQAERSPSRLTADVAALRQRLGLDPLKSHQ